MLITTRLPLVEEGTALVALVIGTPEAGFGDEVSVEAVFDRKRLENYYVAGIDTQPVSSLPVEVVALFGHTSIRSLHGHLEKAYKTGLPSNIQVTVYTLSADPVEEITGTEEIEGDTE